ncbi:hypothetical protein EWM62_04810 [Mucilaginibacter terrigena]|uniref:Uncharacterized protein n=1 Tax=Mucilaginibacter terrigena TaxID=2492395 RepID=A0A4Q5LPE3_9SPHI|nr:hypothetical protein [Mucilaginibacter terrigena]RYU91264.1 hypothetical protein EWM62_04810 [Mucilaginibacter terrigena]
MEAVIVKNKFIPRDIISIVILFAFIWFSLSPGHYKKGLISDNLFQVIIYLFIVIILCGLFQTLFGSILFMVTDKKLVIEKKCLIAYSKKQYQIDKISHLRLIKDAKSNTAWGFQGFRFYFNQRAISFMHDKKQKVIKMEISDNAFNNLKMLF